MVDLDTLRFCQYLAKIAYSYIAALSPPNLFVRDGTPVIGQYEAKIVRFIKRKYKPSEDDLSILDYVGGESASMRYEPSQYLHDIGHAVLTVGKRSLLAVFIRLFGNIGGSPIYICVIGHRDG